MVSAGNQQVGGIDGNGTTQVNAGASLTADHIVQGALIIGGNSGSQALVTIDASDISGNPLSQSSGLVFAGSVTRNGSTAAGEASSANLSGVASTNPESLSAVNPTQGSNLSPVPEPSTLVLMLLAISVVFLSAPWRRLSPR